MKKKIIIAEAGVNHNGSMETAFKLIEAAKAAGADYIKFQTFKTENLVNKTAAKAQYQIENTKNNGSQYSMLKKLELSYSDFIKLKEYCVKTGINFLSSPFDLESIDFLAPLVPFFKIPSGEITNLFYLKKINSYKKAVILSTGMADIKEIQAALDVLKDCPLSLLHCTTQYPCPYNAVNMNAMITMKKHFNLPIGYSDHTEGIEIPIMAAAMGAEIIEKHFTLDKTMKGPDHKASLEPEELKQMVKSIRNIEQAFGSGVKEPGGIEKQNALAARKSLAAKCFIKKGELLSENNITAKRPASGISPMRFYEISGTRAKKDYKEDELI